MMVSVETGKGKDNKSGSANRSLKRGHRQNRNMQDAITDAVNNKLRFDFKDQVNLCELIREKYKAQRGEINHLIRRAMRRKLYDWLVDDLQSSISIVDPGFLRIAQITDDLFPGYVSRKVLGQYCSRITQRNKELANEQD